MVDKVINYFFDNGMLSLKPNSDGEFVYYAGDLIEGSIEFTLKTPTRCRSLYVKIRGKSQIFGTYKKHAKIDNRRHENYLDRKIVIFQHADPVELQAETYKHSFEFQLPLKLPQSCISKMITFDNSFSIIYYCKAVLDVPRGRDLMSKKEFTLKRRDSLNLLPIFQEPSLKSLEAAFPCCCCCCISGKPMKMSVEIPRTGFALGQSIPIKISIDNESGCEIKKLEIKLKKGEVIIYPGHESPLHHEERRENLAKIIHQKEHIVVIYSRTILKEDVAVSNFDKKSYELEYELDIPKDIAISDLLYSQTIKNAHKITVKAIVKWKCKEPKVSIPIVIGSVSSLEKGDYLPDISLSDSEYLSNFIKEGYPKPTWFKID